MARLVLPESYRMKLAAANIPKSLKGKLFKCLEELEKLEFSDTPRLCREKASTALYFIFALGRKPLDFNETEMKHLGDLLIDTLDYFKSDIRCIGMCSTPSLSGILRKRSALQFLVDVFGHFPARNSTLKDELQKCNIDISMEILDRVIQDSRDLIYYSDDSDYENPSRSSVPDIPDTHVWWQ